MKKFTFSLLAAALTSTAFAQSDGNVLDTVFEYKVPFQVPDNPAFKSLDIDPSNVLRPTDLKTFAFTLAPYVTSQGLALPRNFALEFSPGRIASKYWTIDEYGSSKWKRFAYGLSFNMATKFEDNVEQDPFRIALGVRYQYTRKEDNPALNKYLNRTAEAHSDASRKLTSAYLISVNQTPTTSIILRIESPQNKEDSALAANFEAWLAKRDLPDSLKKYKDVYNLGRFETMLAKYEAEHWNDFRWDFAAAWVGQSGDTVVKDVRYNMVNAWVTLAFRPGKKSTHSQILLGGFGRVSANPDSLGLVSTLSFSARYYYGDAKVRGFAETQYKWNGYKERSPAPDQSLLINFGLEAKLGGKLGVFASAGVENFFDPGDPWSRLRSSLNLRYFLE